MDDKRIQEILRDRAISVLKKKYYFNGEYIGTFSDLCLKLVKLDNLNSKEKEYFEQTSTKPCDNRQRKRVSKCIMAHVKECSKTLTINSNEGADVTLKGAEGFKIHDVQELYGTHPETGEEYSLGNFGSIYSKNIGVIKVDKVKSLVISFSDIIDCVYCEDNDYENKKYILEKDFNELGRSEDQENLISKLEGKSGEEKKGLLDEYFGEIIGSDPWDFPPTVNEEYFNYDKAKEYFELMEPHFRSIVFYLDMHFYNLRDNLTNKRRGIFVYRDILSKIKRLFETQPSWFSLKEWNRFYNRHSYFLILHDLENMTKRETTWALMSLISQEYQNEEMTGLLLSMGYPHLTHRHKYYIEITEMIFNFNYLD